MQYPNLKTIVAIVISMSFSAPFMAEIQSRSKPVGLNTPGSSVAFISKVDSSTLIGKVMVAYQGWYNIDGDLADRGWLHWTKNRYEPVAALNLEVELFPDLSEFGPEERFETSIIKPDGKPVEIYSSLNPDTVERHFQWMHDYRIDGAFIKRFASDLQHPRSTIHTDIVLKNVRTSAANTGRTFAITYVLAGMGPNQIDRLIEDWKALNEVQNVTADDAYLKHENKPVVGVLGVGFAGRDYPFTDCQRFISFLKEQGCAVMVGVPANWQQGGGDAIEGPALLELLRTVDIINPTTLGLYQNPREVRTYGVEVWREEKAWCDSHGIDYLPMIFPGYSRGSLDKSKQDIVPRQYGKLLWAQFQGAKISGCEMAMIHTFDGMHNGTAILKFDKTATNIPDVHGIGFEDIPNDYYLKLTGDGGTLIKNSIARRDSAKKAPSNTLP